MSRVRSRNTLPELTLRRLLSDRGVRYRLHRSDLPGKPDLFISRLRLALFVNGCFWHGHECSRGRLPLSNRDFWKTKIDRNKQRDEAVIEELRKRGIDGRVVWTCRKEAFEELADTVATQYRNCTKRTDLCDA